MDIKISFDIPLRNIIEQAYIAGIISTGFIFKPHNVVDNKIILDKAIDYAGKIMYRLSNGTSSAID